MNWEIDAVHSHVSFAIRVMSISTTKGRFHAPRGHLHIDEQNTANSRAAAEVDAASIDTRNKLRDAHLRSAAFFDVKKYPTISFESTNVEQIGGQNYRVTGNLTLHGVSKSITFDVAFRDQSAPGSARVGLVAKAMINRNDFGIGRGVGVRFAASAMVAIEIDLEDVQIPAEGQERAAVDISRHSSL